MNFVWGAFSDQIGRKKVLIAGISVCLLTTLTLGLTRSYWTILACRFVAGSFGANSTVAKSFIGDLAREQRTRAWAYSLYGSVYGLCGIIGPVLGGVLVNPVGLYPELFGGSEVLKAYPFLLITSLISIMSFGR